MAVTVAQFRLDFPAFKDATAYPDPSIQFWLDLSVAFVGANWGAFQDKGTELFTAHNLALGPSIGAGGIAIGGSASGPIASKSIKDVSVSYSTAIGTDEGAGFYNGTIYGRQYWQLRRLFGIGVIHLAGDEVGGAYGFPGTSIYPLAGLS